MKPTFENLTLGAEVLVVEQPANHFMLKGTVGTVDSWDKGSVRVITRFPSGELFAKWQPYHSLVLLPERSEHVGSK